MMVIMTVYYYAYINERVLRQPQRDNYKIIRQNKVCVPEVPHTTKMYGKPSVLGQ